VRGRLRNIETTIAQVEDFIESDRRWAQTLRRIWAYEFHSKLFPVEEEEAMTLAREVHAGNPEALAEVEAVLVEQSAHVDARAREHVAGLPKGEQSRWRKLLSGR
jgi:hypothetical protein